MTAIDTEPLAPRVDVVLAGAHGPFETGLKALARLTDGAVYVCTAPGGGVPVPDGDRFRREEFAGVHPAGAPGLHIHRLDPVSRDRQAWYVGYQDVVAMGRLFDTGELAVERVVALAGPAVSHPGWCGRGSARRSPMSSPTSRSTTGCGWCRAPCWRGGRRRVPPPATWAAITGRSA